MAAGFIQISKGLLAFFTDIVPAVFQFHPSFVGSIPDFFLRNPEFFREDFDQAVRHDLFACQCKERIHEINLSLYDLVHIVFDIFRIGGNDRAVVVVVRIRKFIPFVWNARVEDPVHILTDQPLHMAVGKLCRIALGLAWDGFDSHLIDLSRRRRRKNNGKSQFCKEGKPQRVIFVHVQYSWKSDRSVRSLFLWKRLVAKIPFIFIGEEVWNIGVGLFLSKTPLTTVSGDETSSAGKLVDCQTAVVGTSLTFCHGCFVCQIFNIFDREHGCLFAVICMVPFTGNQCCSKCSHDSGDIRADSLAVGDFFKAAQYSIVIESTALDNNVLTKFRCVGNLDNLEQRILDDGVGKTGGNIGNRSAFFLGLLYF